MPNSHQAFGPAGLPRCAAMLSGSGPSQAWLVATLVARCGDATDSGQTADALIWLWRDIADALHAVIGREGVNALCDRSLTLTAIAHPWLGQVQRGTGAADLATLEAAIAAQIATEANAGAGELLQRLYDVLVSLIGSELCEQLLASIRENPGAGRKTHNL